MRNRRTIWRTWGYLSHQKFFPWNDKKQLLKRVLCALPLTLGRKTTFNSSVSPKWRKWEADHKNGLLVLKWKTRSQSLSLGFGPVEFCSPWKALACYTGKALGEILSPNHLWSRFYNETSRYFICLKIKFGVSSHFVIYEHLWHISDVFILSSSLMWHINWFSFPYHCSWTCRTEPFIFRKAISMKCDLWWPKLCVL